MAEENLRLTGADRAEDDGNRRTRRTTWRWRGTAGVRAIGVSWGFAQADELSAGRCA